MSYELTGLLMLLSFVVGLLFGLAICYTRRPKPQITRTRKRTRRSIH